MASLKHHLFVFLGISTFWWLLFLLTGVLFAGLHLEIDIYGIMLHYYNNSKPIYEDMIEVWTQMRSYIFAPVGLFYELACAKFLGANIFPARLIYLLFGIFSSFLFFLTARELGFSLKLSLLFPALAFLGEQFWVWYNIHCHEPVGLFFMSLSLYLIAMAAKKGVLFDVLAILVSLLMSLSKESFILVLPALVVFKFYCAYTLENQDIKKGISKSLFFAVAIFLIFVAEITYILLVMKGGGRGYAGVSASTGIGAYVQNFFSLFLANDVYVYLCCALLLVAFLTGGQVFGNLLTFLDKNLILVIFVLAILLPQAVLYTQTGWQSRYYLPSFVGIAFFCVVVLNHLERYAPHGTYALYFSMLIFYMALEIFPKISDNPNQTFRFAKNYASFAEQTELLLQSVVSQSQTHSLILIVSDPVENVVMPMGLESFLKNLYQRNNIKHYPISIPYQHSEISQARIANARNDMEQIKDKSTIEHIVIMPHREALFLKESQSWFDASQYHRFAFWKLVHYAKK